MEGASSKQECGTVVNNTLKSPGYPEDYPNNVDCNYTVHIPSRMKVKYELKYFKLEDPDRDGLCSYDYLQMAITPKLKDSEKHCGNKTGFIGEIPAAGTDRYVELTFHTDNKNRDKGFHITYVMLQSDSVDLVPQCGSVVNNTLKSPGYPDDYPSGMDCSYTVPIPPNMTMNITFIHFELEPHRSCLYDYLRIENDKKQIGDTYCGQKTGKNVFVTGVQVSITFHSDSIGVKSGFDLHFTAVPHVPPKIDPVVGPVSPGNKVSCSARGTPPIYTALIWDNKVVVNKTNSSTIRLYKEGNYTCKATSKYGTDTRVVLVKGCSPKINNTLKSPGYPEKYPHDTDCTSSIPVPLGMMSINISFQEIYLEYSSSCGRDYLEITNEKKQVFGKYCGNHTGQTVLVSGKYALIKFHSDGSLAGKGFLMHFTLVPLTVPEPVAFYPLNARYKAAEKENRQPEGILGDVVITDGPYNEPGGAYMFYGTVSSYIEFPNRGGLDTRFSITMMCWVQPGGQDGPLFSYGKDGGGIQIWIEMGRFSLINIRNDGKAHRVMSTYTLPAGVWARVVATYDYDTGLNSIYINGHLNKSQNIDKGYEISTNAEEVRMGTREGDARYFKGKITEMKVYNVALNEAQIKQMINQVPTTTETGQPTQGNASSNETMIFILSGSMAFILLLVSSFVLGFLCYRKLHRKRIDRSARSVHEIIPLDKWELLPEEIKYEEELGRGAFGVVYKATLKRRVGIEVFDTEKTLKPKEPCQVVAVKVLQDNPSEDQKGEFLQEIEQMKLLGAHQNIVSLVGCCTLQEQKFLVIEYVPFGDLLQWLRRRRRSINRSHFNKVNGEENSYQDKETFSAQRDVSNSSQETRVKEKTPRMTESTPSLDTRDVNLDITMSSEDLVKENNNFMDQENIDLLPMPSTSQGNSNAAAKLISTENIDGDNDDEAESFTDQQLFSFAWQIAKGMNHLAEKDFIHRDLAARNILVGSDNRVKVSDFGLMRQIYEDVYSIKKSKKLPVKWMAPESIVDGIFNIKSDIWSFGILLWEMATMGGIPYPTLTNSELCKLLKTGYRMERPDMCSDEVYELMCECWREDPLTRPTFSGLIDRLEVILMRDVPYCELSRHVESRLYYNVPV